MIGLGRMGANMVRRLLADGHRCVVYDTNPAAAAPLVAEGATAVADLAGFTAALRPPRAVWIMVPAAVVDSTLAALSAVLEPGDTIIDGGNSWYRDDVDRAARLADGPRLAYVDVGTSGGVHGLERGYCLMVGGTPEAVAALAPILDTLAPGIEAAATRTPGRSGPPAPEERGWLHCGPSGAGHFVKMVHNGIEYGLMAAYAEGFNILAKANVGAEAAAADAETAPLAHPEYYRYDFDLRAVSELWRRGSVISSWLLDLTAAALEPDPTLTRFSGVVADSGEGRWTLHAAIDEGVPTPVLSTALHQRFSSRGRADLADRVLSAMREQFGGHQERPA
jgi:6-phosphogluconate dehydrogenase